MNTRLFDAQRVILDLGLPVGAICVEAGQILGRYSLPDATVVPDLSRVRSVIDIHDTDDRLVIRGVDRRLSLVGRVRARSTSRANPPRTRWWLSPWHVMTVSDANGNEIGTIWPPRNGMWSGECALHAGQQPVTIAPSSPIDSGDKHHRERNWVIVRDDRPSAAVITRTWSPLTHRWDKSAWAWVPEGGDHAPTMVVDFAALGTDDLRALLLVLAIAIVAPVGVSLAGGSPGAS